MITSLTRMSCVALSLLLFAACGDDDPAPATTPTTDVVDTDTAAGDVAAGDVAAGDVAADDVAAGDTAAGDTAAGDAVTLPGDVIPTDTAAGDVAAGDTAAGDVAAGDTAAGDVMAGPMSILETATANEDFSTLVTAVTAAGLVETLSGDGPFTIFAPTNAAFGGLPEATLNGALADPDGLLKYLVLYHAVGGKVMAADVMGMTSATTLNGADVAISIVDEQVVLNGMATVTLADIECTNGVIHVIDAVLMPSTCQSYCGAVAMNCTEENAITWTADCATDCAGWPEGEAGDTAANTTQCRLYHANAAAADAGLHCPHASPDGGGTCVDAE